MKRATVASALLGVLLGLALQGLAAQAPATAAPRDSSGAGRATFGVRPTGKNGPDDRPTFAYAATPGGVFTDQVEISNAGTEPLTLRVYASDAFTPRTGGFDLFAGGTAPTDAGAWVKMSKSSVTVAARGRTVVPFTLTVPATATPGDHTAGIVASLARIGSDVKGNRVTVDQRVGARIYLRVSGALEPRLTVEGLSVTYHPTGNPFGTGRTTLVYRVRNTGNVRLSARQKITVQTLWGTDRQATGVADVPEVLPGSAVDFTAEVPGVLPAIWLTGKVHADPVAGPGDAKLPLTAIDREYGFWAMPWTWIFVLIGVLVLGGAWFAVRRFRRRSASPPAVPDAGA